MTPTEAINQVNMALGPVLVFTQSARSAQAVALEVNQLASVLYRGMGLDNVTSEIERWRTGEVDVIVCDKTYLVGVNLRRDDEKVPDVLWCFAPSPIELSQGNARAERTA